MENSFLPANYEAPKSGGYTDLPVGKTKLRILSSPLMVWLAFTNNVPKRTIYTTPDSAPAKGSGEKDSVKHAWVMIVYNYTTQKIEIWECDKVGIQTTIKTLSENPAWGHPKKFDIVVSKEGSGMNTKYSVTPEPPSEPTQDIIEAYTDCPIDLNQMLIENGNPFLSKQAANPTNVNTTPAATQAKVVTPENWVQGDAIPAGWISEDGGVTIKKKALPF